MWKKVILSFAFVCGAWSGFSLYHALERGFPKGMDKFGENLPVEGSILFTVLGAIIFLFAGTLCAEWAGSKLREIVLFCSRIPMNELAAGAAGLVGGLLLSLLLYPAMIWLGKAGQLIQVPVTLAFGYMGLRIGLEKKEELASLWTTGRFGQSAEPEGRGLEEHKILDTSVIIDGRIADICKTGFIEGTIVIPEFVLEELQHIADSSDLLKRNRGRRGLDILNKIQKELDVKVLIYEGDFEEISEVDSKLVKLAKVLRGKVVTNDFNLNKVCELQGVSVLNINDLANAVKPVVLPGEEIIVQVIKDGKEHGQGVAYLDDGTMIVVEGGREYIGTTMEVLVTSVLQTSAGRMIFAKPKLLEKHNKRRESGPYMSYGLEMPAKHVMMEIYVKTGARGMSNSVGVVIVAAGRGTRMGTVESKQYLLLQGKPIIVHTLEVFQKHELISEIVLVTGKEDIARCQEWIQLYKLDKVTAIIPGGSERQHSVHKGLLELGTDWVMVHDGVRPFVHPREIEACYEQAKRSGASVLAVPVKDTIKQVDSAGKVLSTPDRRSLWAIQTPQTFRLSDLLGAYEAAEQEGFLGTDDSSLAERAGISVSVVEGSYRNIKITTPEDLDFAEFTERNRGEGQS